MCWWFLEGGGEWGSEGRNGGEVGWLSSGILCEKIGCGEIGRRGDDGTGLIWEEVKKLLDT